MRFVSICAALLLLIALGSCSGDSAQGSINRDSTKVFTLSDAQIAALDAAPAPDVRNDGPAQPGDRISVVPLIFADQTLPTGATHTAPAKPTVTPSTPAIPSVQAAAQPSPALTMPTTRPPGVPASGIGFKNTSSYNPVYSYYYGCWTCNGYWYYNNCWNCTPPCKVVCKSICNTGLTSYDMKCETGCADVTYKVHVTYNDCPDRTDEALGHVVIFYRNGVEVGRATTDIKGDASFADTCLDPGTYNIGVTSECCSTCYKICVKPVDCCVVECTNLLNDTERFFKGECDEGYADVDYKFNLEFSECPNKPTVKSGAVIVIKRDGVEVGRATTDANGDASFEEDDVPLGTFHITAATADGHCATEFDITTYDDCHYHACLTGYGKIPGVNGDPYMVFSYETHVDAGILKEIQRMSLTDGDISFTDVPTTWTIDLGLEAYFGNDNVMFHTIDNGKAKGVDFVEVWVFDRGYHNSGLLTSGQIRASWGLHAAAGPIWP